MGDIIFTRLPAGVARIEIDNPPANALSLRLREKLEGFIDRVDRDLDLRVLILTGTGKGFCAGEDLKEVAQGGAGAVDGFRQFMRLTNKIEELRIPVIGVINGYAIGGGLELALCCDIRIMAEDAWFLGAGVNVGLAASTYRLPRLVGIAAAKAMLLTGKRIDAAAAQAMQLVSEVHPAEALHDAALQLATRIATRAPLSVEASKRMIGQAFDLDPAEASALTLDELIALASTEDHQTALNAFAAGREPSFSRK
jgi:enoyl-CoA hydratase/carnithine racemase